MSKKHNLPSSTFYNRTKLYICTGEGCNNPVEYHFVSIDIHKIFSACITCKKSLDRKTGMGNESASAKTNNREDKIRNLKVRENEKHGFYTVEFWGPPVSEFKAKGMEWMKIFD